MNVNLFGALDDGLGRGGNQDSCYLNKNPKREEKNANYIFSLDVVTVDDARACVTNVSRKKPVKDDVTFARLIGACENQLG